MVRKVIDFECILPPDESGKPRQFQESASHRIGYGDPELLEALPGHGFGNYVNIFTKRQAGNIPAQGKPAGASLKDFVAELDREGVEISVLGRVHSHLLADVVAAYPTHFFALAAISPFDGMRGVREFEHLVRERGLHGLRVAALYNNVAGKRSPLLPALCQMR